MRLSKNIFKPNSCWLTALCLACALASAEAQSDQAIYTDSLQNGWEDWSYGATRDFNFGGTYVHSGTKAVGVTLSGFGALSLHHGDIDASAYASLTFWINGAGSSGQQLKVYAELGTTAQPAVNLPTLTAIWQQITLSLAELGVAGQPNFARFSIQNRTGSALATFYVDDINLVGAPAVTNRIAAISIDAQANRHPISPLIYGTAFASSSNQLLDLNSPLHRSGGNAETRNNWELNAHNRGADWFFESIPDGPAIPGDSANGFVTLSKGGGAQPLLTIPMLGWVPKLTPGRSHLASYSIAKYGPQTAYDTSYYLWNDFGNGIGTNSTTQTSWVITTNNPTDANFLTNSVFQRAFVQHLTNRWGSATNGGVRYYCMDNEHTLWHSTHRDVHPVGTTMQEIRDKFFDYGGKVKAVDPNALLLAPEEWGWPGYLYSGHDWQWAGANNNYNPANYPDRLANGGMDYMPWFLDQARQRELSTGQRLLDYFTLHIYPQGVNEFTGDTSTGTQLGRNRSTRALWDTNYVDASWINQKIMLIPRMKNWVTSYYPGTKTGITEYNWGAEDHINGATAQADILGIFGREGLDLATRWTTPAASSPSFKAMKMYRNYDGNKSGFGDISISAVCATNVDYVSAFAAQRSTDGALTAMIINKQLTATATAIVTLTNFPPAHPVQVWQLTSNNLITRLSDLNLTGKTFTNLLPAQSITLFVVGAAPAPKLRDASASGGSLNFWMDGQAGQRYWIQSSTNLTGWSTVQTSLLAGDSLWLAIPLTTTRSFFRAVWVP